MWMTMRQIAMNKTHTHRVTEIKIDVFDSFQFLLISLFYNFVTHRYIAILPYLVQCRQRLLLNTLCRQHVA